MRLFIGLVAMYVILAGIGAATGADVPWFVFLAAGVFVGLAVTE